MKFLSLLFVASSSVSAAPYRFGKIDGSKFKNSFTSGGAFYLRNVGLDKLIEVPYGQYEEGKQMNCYSPNYKMAQRFVLEKQFSNTYTIRPLGNQNFFLRTLDPGDSGHSKLDLHREEYSNKYSLIQNKFAFISAGGDAYFIKTQGGSGDFYLGAEKGGSHDLFSSPLPNNPDASYFAWKIEETDNITPNVTYNVVLDKKETKRLLPVSTYTAGYTIYFSDKIGEIELRENNATETLEKKTNSDHLDFDFEKGKFYDLYITNTANAKKNITIEMTPNILFTQYSGRDFDKDDIDRSQDTINLIDDLEKKRFHTRNYFNLNKEEFLKKKPFDSNFVIMRSHGGPGYFATFEGFENDNTNYLCWYDLPKEIFNICTSWYSCDSAAMANGDDGYRTNLPRECVIRGSSYSFGFREEIYSVMAASHNKFFLKALLDNKNSLDAARWATYEAKKENLILSLSDKGLPSGIMYFKENGSVKYTSIYSNSEVFSDDGGYQLNNLEDEINLDGSEFEVKTDDVNVYHDLFLTNIQVDEKNLSSFESAGKALFAKYDCLVPGDFIDFEKVIVSKNGTIQPYLLCKESDTEVVFYDLINKQFIDAVSFSKMSSNLESWRI